MQAPQPLQPPQVAQAAQNNVQRPQEGPRHKPPAVSEAEKARKRIRTDDDDTAGPITLTDLAGQWKEDREKLAVVEPENEALKAKVKELEEKVRVDGEALKKAGERNAKLAKESEEFKKALDAAVETNGKLTAEKERLAEAKKGLVSETATLKIQVAKLEELRKQKDVDLAFVSEQRDTATAKVEVLEGQKAGLVKERDGLQKEVDELKGNERRRLLQLKADKKAEADKRKADAAKAAEEERKADAELARLGAQ